MSDEWKTKVQLKLSEEEMIFKCDLGDIKVEDCIIDEKHDEEMEMIGPDPSRLLSLAILSCLNASFVYCLSKRNLRLDELESEAEFVATRNEKDLWRIKEINVKMNPLTYDDAVKKRINQCLRKSKEGNAFFEELCTVTESVRAGVKVNVEINFL